MIQNLNKDWDLFRKDQGISGTEMHDYQKSQDIYAGYINPTIIEERKMNVASMDVFSRLMMEKIIFLGTAIDDTVSNVVTAQLLYLSSQSENDINMYVNSPGGGIYAGYSIFDTMNFIKNEVHTTVTGMAASMGFLLSINGSKRLCLPHSRLMLHQPLSSMGRSQATDIMIRAQQIQKLKDETIGIIAEKCNQTIEKVSQDVERDYWMTSEEAKEYGAIDKIVGIDD